MRLYSFVHVIHIYIYIFFSYIYDSYQWEKLASNLSKTKQDRWIVAKLLIHQSNAFLNQYDPHPLRQEDSTPSLDPSDVVPGEPLLRGEESSNPLGLLSYGLLNLSTYKYHPSACFGIWKGVRK